MSAPSFQRVTFYFNEHAELFSFLFQLNFTGRFCYISGISLARDIYYRTTEVFGCVFHPTNFTGRFCYISGISLAIDSRQVHCACIASRYIPIVGIRYYNFENGCNMLISVDIFHCDKKTNHPPPRFVLYMLCRLNYG